MAVRTSMGVLAMLMLTGWATVPATAEVVSGEIFYRERIALPPDAVVEVTLVDITRLDRPGELVAAVQIRPRQQVPIPFQVHVPDAEVDPRRVYAIRARIVADGRLRFVTASLPRVLTFGNPNTVRIQVLSVSSGGQDADMQQLTGRIWLAEDIAGRGVLDNVQSRFSIGATGEVAGSGGCNNLRGTAQVDGPSLAFDALATTRKMCPPAVMEQEARFLQALERTREFRIEGPHLKLLGTDGVELARLTELR